MGKEELDPFDDSDQQATEARDAEVKRLTRAREVDDLKWLMGHVQGRRIMWRLLEMTGVGRTPYVMEAKSEDNAFRSGAQNIGLQLQAELHEVCYERIGQMTKEHVEWLTKLL